jgi:hypothetical protein
MPPRKSDPKARINWSRVVSAVSDNAPVGLLVAIAFTGSFGHATKLVAKNGQGGWIAYAIAGCIDLQCYIAAKERMRDKRIGRRKRFGIATYPTLFLVFGIIETLAVNLATAMKTPTGYAVAAIPAVALLLAVALLERRASFDVATPEEEEPAAAGRGNRRSSGAGNRVVVGSGNQALAAAGYRPGTGGRNQGGPGNRELPAAGNRELTASQNRELTAGRSEEQSRPEQLGAAAAGGGAEVEIPVAATTDVEDDRPKGSELTDAELLAKARTIAEDYVRANRKHISQGELGLRLRLQKAKVKPVLDEIKVQLAPLLAEMTAELGASEDLEETG